MRACVRVLGPLEAEVGGVKIDLGGPLQRAVLAVLLIERGRVISVDRLIDQLWRGEPPPRAIASLQAYVSNLRRVLEPGRRRRAPAGVLVSAPPGYALRLPGDAVDAWQFESLLNAAHESAVREPQTARRILDSALALWHGPAYAEFADQEWAVTEVATLTELQLTAQELWPGLALRTGPPAQAVPPAEELCRLQPLREESWRLLALALWACDRQADALAALRRARRVLRAELGLDPGPALAALEDAILGQHLEVLQAALSGPDARGGAIAPAVPAEPAEPGAGELFVGRADQLTAIAEAAGVARQRGGVVLVTGEPERASRACSAGEAGG